jgi:hypothetical protein
VPENGSGIKAQMHTWLMGQKRAGAPLWFLKTHGNQWQRDGVPDYLISVAGQFLAIELKAPEKPATPAPLQAIELRDLKRAGALTLCTNNLEEAKRFVRVALETAGWYGSSRVKE